MNHDSNPRRISPLRDLHPRRRGVDLPTVRCPPRRARPGLRFLHRELALPEIGQLDLVRHYTHLSHRNFSVDDNFYPLGSCTMKYNPKVNEWAAALPGFANLHPDAARATIARAPGAALSTSASSSRKSPAWMKSRSSPVPGARRMDGPESHPRLFQRSRPAQAPHRACPRHRPRHQSRQLRHVRRGRRHDQVAPRWPDRSG